MSPVVLFIGFSFSILAAISAFLIDLEEQRHHYQGWRMPIKVSLATALIAFLTFGVITLVTAWALPLAVQ